MSLHSLYDTTLAELHRILSSDGKCVYASGSYNYQTAVFGRDSAEIGEDLLRTIPEIAKRAILSLSSLQGIVKNEISEEEPGKIPHEYRNKVMGGVEISIESQAILRMLSERWGGTEDEVIYYGSVDATPLYIRLVINYCNMHGKTILKKPVPLRNGSVVTVEDCLLNAVEYIERTIESSNIGLLEFKTTNQFGHIFQTWKDSRTSFIHLDGKIANVNHPIASIDVQGLAYDALVLAAKFFPTKKDKVAKWLSQAAYIQSQILNLFWNDETQYFAMGLDRDNDGKVRQIVTESSDPAILLETKIFDTLPIEKRLKYISPIIQQMFSKNFLTDAGIRCRSVKRASLIECADYHGSWAVWPKQTNDVIYGLIKQGCYRLAEQLAYRLINGIYVNGKPIELFYVTPEGKVNYHPSIEHPNLEKMYPNLMGEDFQGWTMSAVINSFERISDLNGKKVLEKETEKLESAVLKDIEIFSTATIETNKEKHQAPEFYLDIKEGNRRRDEFLEKQGLL